LAGQRDRPGVEQGPSKKLETSEELLLALLHRWRAEAVKAGRSINHIAVAFEAGRDGFWLACWLRACGVEAHVIPATSLALSREHRRAKTDRLDAALLQRAFLGWLRGERGHCSMVTIPSFEEENAKRPSRERESLVGERTRIGNRIKGTLARQCCRGGGGIGWWRNLRLVPRAMTGADAPAETTPWERIRRRRRRRRPRPCLPGRLV
jgi:transposase